MNTWSQLRPLSKLDQLAETSRTHPRSIMKTALTKPSTLRSVSTAAKSHHVTQSYLNHKGAHFKVINRVGESEYDILCRQINIEKTNYAFVSKSDLERGLRDDLWIGLVVFIV